MVYRNVESQPFRATRRPLPSRDFFYSEQMSGRPMLQKTQLSTLAVG
jgi:hypothetical protein